MTTAFQWNLHQLHEVAASHALADLKGHKLGADVHHPMKGMDVEAFLCWHTDWDLEQGRLHGQPLTTKMAVYVYWRQKDGHFKLFSWPMTVERLRALQCGFSEGLLDFLEVQPGQAARHEQDAVLGHHRLHVTVNLADDGKGNAFIASLRTADTAWEDRLSLHEAEAEVALQRTRATWLLGDGGRGY